MEVIFVALFVLVSLYAVIGFTLYLWVLTLRLSRKIIARLMHKASFELDDYERCYPDSVIHIYFFTNVISFVIWLPVLVILFKLVLAIK